MGVKIFPFRKGCGGGCKASDEDDEGEAVGTMREREESGGGV